VENADVSFKVSSSQPWEIFALTDDLAPSWLSITLGYISGTDMLSKKTEVCPSPGSCGRIGRLQKTNSIQLSELDLGAVDVSDGTANASQPPMLGANFVQSCKLS
jgi:hypothetical protein